MPDDDEMGDDHVYQIIVTIDVSTASTIAVSCDELAPQLVRVALELAADYLVDVSEWTITAESAGAVLQPAVPVIDDEE